MLEAVGLTSRVFQQSVAEPKKASLHDSSREALALRPYQGLQGPADVVTSCFPAREARHQLKWTLSQEDAPTASP